MSADLLIRLPGGVFTVIESRDWFLIAGYKWLACKSKVGLRVQSFEKTNGKQKTIFMHRLIMGAVGSEFIDHARGNSLDNRRRFLRRATPQENSANQKLPRNNSGFKGVTKRGSKWIAQIGDSWRRVHLGMFESAVEGAHSYDEAARKRYGEFAALNFPKDGESACRR